MQEDSISLEREKLHLETSQIAWHELQRFFATGQAIAVSSELDLVEAAYQLTCDNTALIEQWLLGGQLTKVTDQQALTWYEANATVWAVVVKPWVLVQLVSVS